MNGMQLEHIFNKITLAIFVTVGGGVLIGLGVLIGFYLPFTWLKALAGATLSVPMVYLTIKSLVWISRQ